MKLQKCSKSGSTKTRSDRCVPDPCDVIGLTVLKGLIERTKDSVVIAMDAVQIASRNSISSRVYRLFISSFCNWRWSSVFLSDYELDLRCETCRLVCKKMANERFRPCTVRPDDQRRRNESIEAKWGVHGVQSFRIKGKLKQLISVMILAINQCICWWRTPVLQVSIFETKYLFSMFSEKASWPR